MCVVSTEKGILRVPKLHCTYHSTFICTLRGVKTNRRGLKTLNYPAGSVQFAVRCFRTFLFLCLGQLVSLPVVMNLCADPNRTPPVMLNTSWSGEMLNELWSSFELFILLSFLEKKWWRYRNCKFDHYRWTIKQWHNSASSYIQNANSDAT